MRLELVLRCVLDLEKSAFALLDNARLHTKLALELSTKNTLSCCKDTLEPNSSD